MKPWSPNVQVSENKFLTMRLMSAVLILLWTLVSAAAPAKEHDQARALVDAGKILPLENILTQLADPYRGRLLNATLGQKGPDALWFYEIRMLNPDGSVLRLIVNAKTARVLNVKSGRRS